MTNRVDCVVIGAGVIGLSVARRLAMTGVEAIVVEAAATVGTQTSSRNSEVIHAGIYYPAASLKARLCVAGKHALYAYCQARGVEHRRCGKLIVATSEAADCRAGAAEKPGCGQRSGGSAMAHARRGERDGTGGPSASLPCGRLPAASSTAMG